MTVNQESSIFAGLSAGHKQKCLIFLHIGNENYFLKNGHLMMNKKSLEMTTMKWMETYLKTGVKNC